MVDYEEMFYQEYKRLNGRKQKKSYIKYSQLFIHHTYHSHISRMFLNEQGEPKLEDGYLVYYSREDSWEGFKKASKQTQKETQRIFDSMDNITAYC